MTNDLIFGYELFCDEGPDGLIVTSMMSPHDSFELVIPGELNGLHISSVADYAFEGCQNICAANILDGVQRIGRRAFEGCSKLHSVRLPATLTEIGRGAFAGCPALTAIYVDEANPTFRDVDGVLYDRELTKLLRCPPKKHSITIPDSVTEIATLSLSGCTELTHVMLPPGLTLIDEWAFQRCTALSSVSIPASVRELGNYAFADCTELRTVSVGGAERLGNSAFENCPALGRIFLPEQTHVFGHGVFTDCPALCIHAPGGSAAHNYAATYGIPCQLRD